MVKAYDFQRDGQGGRRDEGHLAVSVIVITKNEELSLPDCLRSLKAFDDVVIVDSHSTDDTRKVAGQFGRPVVQFDWDGGYPKKKQWALDNAPIKHDWVLLLDADERVSRDLEQEIRSSRDDLIAHRHAAYDIHLRYRFLGVWLNHGHVVTKRALLNRTRCRFPRVDDLAALEMWEVEGHYQPTPQGSVGKLRSRLEHDDQDRLFDYFARHNRYSDWEAFLRADRGRKKKDVNQHRSGQGRLFNRLPGKPVLFFLWSYVVRLGLLDGSAGFHYAVAQAFYYWQISVKEREAQREAQLGSLP